MRKTLKKSLETLVRLKREEKERGMRIFARAQGETARAAEGLSRAEREIAREEELAASNLEFANPHYLRRAKERVADLASRLARLQRDEERQHAQLMVSIREEKTHEKLVERRGLEEAKENVKREQKEAALLAESTSHNKAMRSKWQGI